jgi:hypothetical protein
MDIDRFIMFKYESKNIYFIKEGLYIENNY